MSLEIRRGVCGCRPITHFSWAMSLRRVIYKISRTIRDGESLRKREMWGSRVDPDGPIGPEAIKTQGIGPADLYNTARFPTVLPRVKDFVGESPIVAHAYEKERIPSTMLDRAKVTPWGEGTYDDKRCIALNMLHSFPWSDQLADLDV
jgi:hypothetical protein